MRTAIGAAIIQNNSLLLLRKRNNWILPGGKPNEGESDIECLCREISEELSGTAIGNTNYYKEFEGISPHRKDLIKVRVYLADINGALLPPSGEISESRWTKDFFKYNLSEVTKNITESLKEDGYL